MARRFTLSNIIKLAAAFRADMQEHLEPLVLRHIDEDNARLAAQGERNICASHDATDSNEAMLAAWEAVFGGTMNVASSSSADTMNAAWDLTKALGFASTDAITRERALEILEAAGWHRRDLLATRHPTTAELLAGVR